jgi:hypothetical protein
MRFGLYLNISKCLYRAKKVHKPTTHFGKKILKKKNAPAGGAKQNFFSKVRTMTEKIY